jgi:hypothetical protein
MQTIWLNEQLDPSGLLYACVACINEEVAKECHLSFDRNLTDEQKQQGWIARLRIVNAWDDVPSLNPG